MKFDKRIPKLLAKYVNGELSDQEQIELKTWLDESKENQHLFDDLTSHTYVEGLRRIAAIDLDAKWQEINRRIVTPPVSGLRWLLEKLLFWS